MGNDEFLVFYKWVVSPYTNIKFLIFFSHFQGILIS